MDSIERTATPVPWRLRRRTSSIVVEQALYPESLKARTIATFPHTPEGEHNAEMTLRAVNSYDALVRAAELAQYGLTFHDPACCTEKGCVQYPDGAANEDACSGRALWAVERALKKAGAIVA